MTTKQTSPPLEVFPIEAFSDNYIWCIADKRSAKAVVVDPGEAAPVLNVLSRQGLSLAAIILTHHHFDHVDGINDLLLDSQVPVYGPYNPQLAIERQQLREGETLTLLGHRFEVLEVPGHTLDHIAYYSPDLTGLPALFCGDTLFAGGCGRMFEGDAAMMLASLDKLASLPASCQVYCAHEYTLANRAFARTVEPDNTALRERLDNDTMRRAEGIPTLPSELALELQTNPFLRCREEAVVSAARQHNPGIASDEAREVFATIRSWKDHY